MSLVVSGSLRNLRDTWKTCLGLLPRIVLDVCVGGELPGSGCRGGRGRGQWLSSDLATTIEELIDDGQGGSAPRIFSLRRLIDNGLEWRCRDGGVPLQRKRYSFHPTHGRQKKVGRPPKSSWSGMLNIVQPLHISTGFPRRQRAVISSPTLQPFQLFSTFLGCQAERHSALWEVAKPMAGR